MPFDKFGWTWPNGLEKKIFKFRNEFSLFRYYLPLEKDVVVHLKKKWFPFTQGCFVSSLVEIGPVVLKRKMKMWNVYNNDDANDDNDGQRTNFNKKSFRTVGIRSKKSRCGQCGKRKFHQCKKNLYIYCTCFFFL